MDWLANRPYSRASEADAYYAAIATTVYQVLKDAGLQEEIFKTDEMMRRAAMSLTGLFEDIISGIGTWDLVVSESIRRYGRVLPFYGASGYERGEINLQDVQLLLWDLCQSCREKSVLNPENPGLFSVAKLIFDIFDAEYESAPENTQLKDFLKDPEIGEDYWAVRFRLEWLLQSSFINHRFMSELPAVIDEVKRSSAMDDVGLERAVYAHQVNQLFNFRSNLLSMRCPEILSRICGCDPDGKIAAMRLLPLVSYRYKSVSDRQLSLCREADKKLFEVELDSFDYLETDSFTPDVTSIICSMVNFGEQWYQAGILSVLPSGRQLSEEELADQRMMLLSKASEDLQKKALKALGGKDFALFPSFQKLREFVKSTMGIQIEKAPDSDFAPEGQYILTFDSRTGLALSHGFCHCIATDENPWYDKAKADKDAIGMIVEPRATTYEFTCYLLDHDLLPDARLESIHGPEYGRRFVKDNAQFLADYFHHRFRGDS